MHFNFGFRFLFDPDHLASFGFGDSPVAYCPTDPYDSAVLVELLNSFCVTIGGILCTLVLGGRLSNNGLIRQLTTVYVETIGLSLPWKPEDWEVAEEAPCWKLIAGVMEL